MKPTQSVNGRAFGLVRFASDVRNSPREGAEISYGVAMTSRNLPAALAVSVLVFAACGGGSSDGDGASGDSPFGGGADDELDIADQILEQNGIDVSELTGDDDLDLGDLAELEAGASDAIDSLANGSGAATITIDGVPYQMSGATCFVFGDDINLDGPGTTPDGEPFWGSVSYTVNNRAEMAEDGLFDEAFLDQMFGDKQQAIDLSVDVEIGKADRFESAADGKASYTAEVFMDNPFFGEVTFEKSGSTVSGSGDMIDDNGVVANYGDLIPFEFTASCS